MQTNRHLDINEAVRNFLNHCESLSRLPLISDDEMRKLFGPEVAAALSELENYNRQAKICRNCAARCCQLVDCEIYAPEFSSCPVYHSRPLLCRMHYCHKFAPYYNLQVKALGDIFLESLIAVEHQGIRRTNLFDCPPLEKLAPALVGRISVLITRVRHESLDKNAALNSILDEAEKFRNEYTD